jgi:hypothetical protein
MEAIMLGKANLQVPRIRWLRCAISLCIIAGSWGCGARPPSGPLSEHEIVALIERNNGSIAVDEAAPGKPVFSVGFSVLCSNPVDLILPCLQGLTHLQYLALCSSNVTDAGMEHLQVLPALTGLELGRTKITDAGLKHLKGLTNLRYLGLDRTKVTGVGFKNLEGLARLEQLVLFDTAVTDTALAHLKKLTQLKYLDVSLCPNITNAGIEDLQKTLPNCHIVPEKK